MLTTIFTVVILLFTGYGFGCFSTGFLVGKIYGVDIRKEGSGNVGTTNALRTLGAKAGILTFLGDILKVLLPALIVRFILFHDTPEEYLYTLTIGLGAVLGHNFPFYLRFKGGKGIAVSGGLIVASTSWWVVLAGLAIFMAVVAITRYVSIGSLIVVWYIPLYTLYYYRTNNYFVWMMMISLLFAFIAYIKHLPNIKRLLNGTENKLGSVKK